MSTAKIKNDIVTIYAVYGLHVAHGIVENQLRELWRQGQITYQEWQQLRIFNDFQFTELHSELYTY